MSGAAGGRWWRKAGLALLALGVLAGAGAGAVTLAETEEGRFAKQYESAAREAFDQGLPATFTDLQALAEGKGPDGRRLFVHLRPHVDAFYGGKSPATFQGDLTPARISAFIRGSGEFARLGEASQWTITPDILANIGPLLASDRPFDEERNQFLGAINMHRSMADLQLEMKHHDDALRLLDQALDMAEAYRLRPFASCQLAALMAAEAIARDAARVRRSELRNSELGAKVAAMHSRIHDEFLKPSDTRGSLWLALARIQLRSQSGQAAPHTPEQSVSPALSIFPGPRDATGRAMAARVLKMYRDFQAAEKEILTDKAPQHGDIIAFVRSNTSPDRSAAWIAPLRREASQQLRILAELRQCLMDFRMSAGLPPRS